MNLLLQQIAIGRVFYSLTFNMVNQSIPQLDDSSIKIPSTLSSTLLYCSGNSMIHVQLELKRYDALGKPVVPMCPV